MSLLARLECAGVDVGARWQDVAGYLAARSGDLVNPFLTLQYLYGLARATRPEADALLDALRRHAANPQVDPVWPDVALPAAEGLVALARGDHGLALRRLGASLGRLAECGGSHAQRDLFNQLFFQAALGAGRDSIAQQLLEERRRYEPASVPTNALLAEVYARLGLPTQAAEARARVDAALGR